MIVTNQTSYDIYFGPLHVPAGVGQTLPVDDTSDTSLYLTDDTVADALNNAYIANKITVTGEAEPFPRPTGEPSLLHGLGSPEGSVYAPPGSLLMRRDNSGAGDALYAKTTGRTFSTGWQTFGVPVVSPWSGGPPSDPLDGDIWIATNVDGSGNGIRWQFQYNGASTSAYKWEFIGGPEIFLADFTNTLHWPAAADTWEQIVGSPSYTYVRSGQYAYRLGLSVQPQVAASYSEYTLTSDGTSGISSSIFSPISNDNGPVGAYVTERESNDVAVGAGRSAGAILQIFQYVAATATNVKVVNPFLVVRPIRVS